MSELVSIMARDNWNWADYFKPGMACFEIFNILRNGNTALSAEEIALKLQKPCKNIWYGLTMLVDRGLILRSEKVRVLSGGKAALFALNREPIDRRIEQLKKEQTARPEEFCIDNRWRKDVLKLVRESDTGFTPQEVTRQLNFSREPPVANTLYQAYRQGVLVRCPFPVPNRIPGVSASKTAIYGRDVHAVFQKLNTLMPQEVRHAFLLVRNEHKVWPMWELKERTNISDQNLKQWFRKAFCKAGLVRYQVHGYRTYYYHPTLPEEAVKREIAGYKEKARQQVLRLTDLGRVFEEKAIFTFVKYLEAKGQQVTTTSDFPKKIPSWLKQGERDKHKEIVEDEVGNKQTIWKNEVWKLDRDPVDFIVFSRDTVMGHRQSYVVSIKKDFCRQYGVGYYSSFIGCVKMGRCKDGTSIPDFLSAIPVFICGEAWGQNIWKFNSDVKGQAGIILTLNKMMKMIEAAGIEFAQEHLFKDLYERQKVYEAYQNHEDVLLKDKGVIELMKEKGFQLEVPKDVDR